MLAIGDLTGCLVNIPLAFSAIVVRPSSAELYDVSYAHVLLTYFMLWCSYFCFVLIGIDMNDTLRKMFRRRTFLTVQRIKVALVALVISAFAVTFFMHSSCPDNPLVLQKSDSRRPRVYRCKIFLQIAVFSAGMLSLLCLVHSFWRVQAILKRQNRIMSELHGLDRRTEQMKQKKLMRTVIEMFVCFVLVYIPFFVASILQEQGKIDTVDPVVVPGAVFLVTYATNVLVYGRNLHFSFGSACSVCCPRVMARPSSRVIQLRDLRDASSDV